MKSLNNKGQSLVEYLILVALMAIASIGVIRAVNQTVKGKFTEINYTLRGKKAKVRYDRIDKSHYKKRDLGDFISGAARAEK